MKDFHLLFAFHQLGRWYDGRLIDLLGDEGEENQIPDAGGAYVIGTAGTMLTYPWGTSPIFYIGSSTNLSQRLSGHRNSMLEARNDWYEYWKPRHQYGAAFGAHVARYSQFGGIPKNVESRLIGAFYYTFGALPSANGQWPNEIRRKQDSENE